MQFEAAPREYERFSTSLAARGPLLDFILEALVDAGCAIRQNSQADEAPFRVAFETPEGERLGIIVYAFTANMKPTRNRPANEHRFQVKYGSKQDNREHELWQDPDGLYTTLFLGIDPVRKIFVGADPVLHSPTRFFISVEFKAQHVDRIIADGWHVWERERRSQGEPKEVLVGGTKAFFLRFIRFEREALGEDQGHRQLLAEQVASGIGEANWLRGHAAGQSARLHALVRELQLPESEVLDLIERNRRLKMAVRGGVAEEHLVRRLSAVSGVTECHRLDDEGGPDVELRFEDSRPLTIECKNVLRTRTAAGLARMDFQRTRASKSDPCSRYYGPRDFDVVAACLHAVTELWEFRYVVPRRLDVHGSCEGKLSNNVRIDSRWDMQVEGVLKAAIEANHE